ncbi:sce7725 family protein [Demequina iriomotensis]|uniref:sce7725 family protein n=1 Tax=Demequina iriomotensis TaxID=1536641 RepID=UPI000783A433|nr:sce7725 family protein [Demequina iriomotensis]
MYFPILRGKRFELLAMRDLAAQLANHHQVFPVVEPVREGTVATDLRRALETWSDANGVSGVVVNPTVGDFSSRGPASDILTELVPWSESLMAGVRPEPYAIVAVGSDVASAAKVIEEVVDALGESYPVGIWIAQRADQDEIANLVVETRASLQLVMGEHARVVRRAGRAASPRPLRVAVSDPFPVRETNAGYESGAEQVFTEEHQYLRDESLEGFADFGTIGNRFRDGGGAPRHVVIHWTYRRGSDSSPVMLRHFKSSDESAVAPVQVKYAEAARALLAFADEMNLPETLGLNGIREYDKSGSFPGLGMLKKLSIMNHLAVMDEAVGAESL